MQSRQAIIANAQGIHCRPSAVIVKEFTDYSGAVRITNGIGSCDVSSVMQLLSLEMHQGDRVTVEVTGANEAAAADRLVELLQTRFDFPPREVP
ncbi:MAG: HPr family phosphocarrier protein [Kiritimatiellae bacterium]|jgi:phosphotransferase system HPr (HPr) family protein|nr:HPr family phosphocarrier protein [Kiritimatiellia bacterium]NLD89842.1 HPr family phosphocarrier protein [Lentisphaerota bacterium]HOU21394.1 HPr family phosphocarrier protein [Kiritimatiellia bacterium]HPC19972.1 HPr family phosphocarrier protein [Kiritimatiellia bacterium]HQQ61071.1 HPr family phosphocarrier protein [Kiritimatiellia bacterium]